MRMSLYVEKGELADAIKSYYLMKTGKRINFLKADMGIIDVEELHQWLDEGYFDKRECKIRIPRTPTISAGITIEDVKNAINLLIRKHRLCIDGDLSFGTKYDPISFLELSKGIACPAGVYNGSTFVEFDVKSITGKVHLVSDL